MFSKANMDEKKKEGEERKANMQGRGREEEAGRRTSALHERAKQRRHVKCDQGREGEGREEREQRSHRLLLALLAPDDVSEVSVLVFTSRSGRNC